MFPFDRNQRFQNRLWPFVTDMRSFFTHRWWTYGIPYPAGCGNSVCWVYLRLKLMEFMILWKLKDIGLVQKSGTEVIHDWHHDLIVWWNRRKGPIGLFLLLFLHFLYSYVLKLTQRIADVTLMNNSSELWLSMLGVGCYLKRLKVNTYSPHTVLAAGLLTDWFHLPVQAVAAWILPRMWQKWPVRGGEVTDSCFQRDWRQVFHN